MDIRQIRTEPDLVLRSLAQEVTEIDAEKLAPTVKRMLEVMKELDGVGIAAPQIGISKRIFGFRFEDEVLFVVNPYLTALTDDKHYGTEGCLSCPGETVWVPRHVGVELAGRSIFGEPSQHRWTDYTARIIQHELDHLNGKLIIDYK